MLSRSLTKAIAELFAVWFRLHHSGPYIRGQGQTPYYTVATTDLYDFLYEYEYPAWLCNAASAIPSSAPRHLKEWVMKLHTGETQAAVTSTWTWPQREKLGQELLHTLAADILAHVADAKYVPDDAKARVAELKASLELSGYVFKHGTLLAPEADVLDAKEESGVLEALWTELGLGDQETALHHLALSEQHYLERRWDDSIGNSRKFLELALREVAVFHSSRTGVPDADAMSRPVAVRDYLERVGLLEAKEKLAIAAAYGLLSHTGSHPYMAENDQARLLRHLSLTFAQFVLLRAKALSVSSGAG
jgi:hypothetical protein